MNVWSWLINFMARFAIFLWWNDAQIVDKEIGFGKILILIIFALWVYEMILINPTRRKSKLRSIK